MPSEPVLNSALSLDPSRQKADTLPGSKNNTLPVSFSAEKGTTSPAKALEVLAEQLLLETIGSLAGALDAKDSYTSGHSHAVSQYAVAMATSLGLDNTQKEMVRLAALLHDIGKIGIPESILKKPGPLTPEETEIMKQHPVIGARQILSPIKALQHVLPMVEHHHENWDGSGHPLGLAGEAIPLGARIVSIVDAFHALTSDRSYRKAMPLNTVKQILNEGAGTKWDPVLIEIFIELLP